MIIGEIVSTCSVLILMIVIPISIANTSLFIASVGNNKVDQCISCNLAAFFEEDLLLEVNASIAYLFELGGNDESLTNRNGLAVIDVDIDH